MALASTGTVQLCSEGRRSFHVGVSRQVVRRMTRAYPVATAVRAHASKIRRYEQKGGKAERLQPGVQHPVPTCAAKATDTTHNLILEPKFLVQTRYP